MGEATPGAQSIQHLFLVIMENRAHNDVIGRPQAPYINDLVKNYASSDAYYGVSHPSVPNYLSLLGGDTFGITTDCTDCIVDARNLVDELEAHGKTWKSYQEDLPQPCFLGESAGSYYMKHDPFLYFRSIRDNPGRCQKVVPLSELETDLSANTVPNFVWITPNVAHDMHDGTVQQGDQWLSGFIPQILGSEAWAEGAALVIVWDEAEPPRPGDGGGNVPFIVIGPWVTPGYRSQAYANHYSLLRTIEELWGLGYTGHAQDPGTGPMSDLFPTG